ncbi:MAG: serine hydrolase [Aeromonadaceae bacterium]|nr:serine hydrolase [Aeromonadaceae bacterium]
MFSFVASARRCFRVSLLAAFSFVPSLLCAQPLTSVLPQFDKDVERIFGAYHVPGAAVAVVQNGKVVYVKTLGVGSTSKGNPVDEHTVFRVASVSKTFAAVLAGQAAYEGQINFNAPLSSYLPGFRLKYDAGNQLTVRNVLSHTSGLPHNANDNLLESGLSYSELLRRTENLGASCPIGRCFGYQNILYSTIGDVLTRQLGHPYPELLKNRIFGPLGMQDASASRMSMVNGANVAVPHASGAKNWSPMAITQPYYNVLPAAGVNASISDMSKYLLAVMGHRPDVIPPAVMQELTKPLIRSPKEGATSKWRQMRIKNPMYGMGWRIFQYNGDHKMIFHAGGLRGVRARLGFLPEKDVGLVMLWNANVSYPEVLMPMLFDRLLDLPAVDYLDGEAGSNDFYARQGHEGVTRVAASLLNERNVSATHPVATPRTASVAPTHAVRTADGITSLTAQRLSQSGKASPVQSSVKPATKSSWKKPVSKKKAVVSKNKSKAKPVTKAKSSKTSKAATKHKAPAKKKSVKTTKPVKKSKAKPVKKKQA